MKNYKQKMNKDKLESIDEKLTTIIKLLAVISARDQPNSKKIQFFHSLGMTSSEISKITGKAPETVRWTLHMINKKTKSKKVKKNNKK